MKILAKYREPNRPRSFFELAVTLLPFLALWALAWYCLSISYWLSFAISLVNAGFLVRLFAIQHDCGHGAFFANRHENDWTGRVLGILTLTPYAVWRRSHSIHHSSSGNLDKRGMGDITTITVAEYKARSGFGRLMYRAYRHPITILLIGPSYVFLFENRLPIGYSKVGKYWLSAMGTNLIILAALATIWWTGGLAPLLLIFLPSTILAATGGVWLFFVQHQFEHTTWNHDPNWDMHEAALHGSSYYKLPAVLQWLSANIGIHHVHHLYSRIPFYRLPEVIRNHSELAEINPMTIRESFASARLHLWDEGSRRLLSFGEAKTLYG